MPDALQEYIDFGVYSDDVARTLLVLSYLQVQKKIPAVSTAVESEFVNGTISYVGGDAGKIKFSSDHHGDRHYRPNLFRYFKKELEGKQLNPKIKKALMDLLHPNPETGPMAYGSTTNLGNIVSQFPFIAFKSTSPIREDTIEKQKRVLSQFSPDERKDLEGIAQAMIPFIQEDLQYIKRFTIY